MSVRYYPLTGVAKNVCAGYGMRGAVLHDADDLCADEGTPIVAVDDGQVHWGADPTGGNVAVLHFADGSALFYAHMKDERSGSARVTGGAQIGRVGRTGNANRPGIPSHVHVQLWPTGSYQVGHAPYPDITADLLAAEVLAAPLGGASGRAPWVKALLVGVAAASALAIGALAWQEVRHPGVLLPWRTA